MRMSWMKGALLCSAAALMTVGTAQAGEVVFDGTGHAYNPVFSMDGEYVAFEVNRYTGDVELFVAQMNGVAIAKDGKRVALPGGASNFSDNQVVVNPTWHPQGLAIFEGSNENGKYRLYFAQPGTAAAEMITQQQAGGDLTFPTVSPDGNNLSFVSDMTGNGDIYNLDRASYDVTQLTSSQSAEMFPLFHESGSKILFTRKVNNTEDIFELDVATKNASLVIGGRGDQTRPTYGANGRIVYFSSESGVEDRWDIFSVDSQGNDKKLLAKSVRLPLRARPALTPDGTMVSFVYDDPSRGDSVWLATLDGSRRVEIKTDFKACGEPTVTTTKGRTVLGYTALPSAKSDWRFLYLVDITDSL